MPSLKPSAKVRLSERKTKYFLVFPNESTFDGTIKGTNKRAKNKGKNSFFSLFPIQSTFGETKVEKSSQMSYKDAVFF